MGVVRKCDCSVRKLQLTVFNKHLKEDETSRIKFKWSPGTSPQQRLSMPHRNEFASALSLLPKEFCLSPCGRPLLPPQHIPKARLDRHGASSIWGVWQTALSVCTAACTEVMSWRYPRQLKHGWLCLQHHWAAREAGQLLKHLTYAELRAATATSLQILGCLSSLSKQS